MKLKKDWLFLKSFRLAKANPGKIGLVILFDLLFFVSFLYVFPYFGNYLAKNLTISQTMSFAITILIFQMLYVLSILFVYSFFKYCVLDSIKSIFHKTEFSLGRLWKFYLLNLILILPPYLVFSFILSGIQEAYRPYVFIFLGLAISPFLYIVINIAQSYFYQENSIKKSVSRGFEFLNKKEAYKEVILIVAIFLLLYGVLLWLISYSFNFIVSNNYTSYLITYSYFKTISIIIFDALFYCIILVNRISFYSLTKESQ